MYHWTTSSHSPSIRGLDPETCTNEYNCPGLDKGAYPNMSKMVLGVSVTF